MVRAAICSCQTACIGKRKYDNNDNKRNYSWQWICTVSIWHNSVCQISACKRYCCHNNCARHIQYRRGCCERYIMEHCPFAFVSKNRRCNSCAYRQKKRESGTKCGININSDTLWRRTVAYWLHLHSISEQYYYAYIIPFLSHFTLTTGYIQKYQQQSCWYSFCL